MTCTSTCTVLTIDESTIIIKGKDELNVRAFILNFVRLQAVFEIGVDLTALYKMCNLVLGKNVLRKNE